jgi:hypothetical protein
LPLPLPLPLPLQVCRMEEGEFCRASTDDATEAKVHDGLSWMVMVVVDSADGATDVVVLLRDVDREAFLVDA